MSDNLFSDFDLDRAIAQISEATTFGQLQLLMTALELGIHTRFQGATIHATTYVRGSVLMGAGVGPTVAMAVRDAIEDLQALQARMRALRPLVKIVSMKNGPYR